MDIKTIAVGLVLGLLLGVGAGYGVSSSSTSNLENEIGLLQDRIDLLQPEADKVPGLEQQVATLTSEKSNLQSQIASLTSEGESLQSQYAGLQNQYSVLQNRYDVQTSRSYDVDYYGQEKSNYCGEACIQMILSYYNSEPLPSQSEIAVEVNLKDITYTSEMPNPFKLRNMWYNVSTSSNFESAYDNLITTVSGKPVIILITWENGNGHYLVVEGGDSNRIKYDDPLYGDGLFLTKEQLETLWFDNCMSHPPQPTGWMLVIG